MKFDESAEEKYLLARVKKSKRQFQDALNLFGTITSEMFSG